MPSRPRRSRSIENNLLVESIVQESSFLTGQTAQESAQNPVETSTVTSD
jgi:hypothetical protein